MHKTYHYSEQLSLLSNVQIFHSRCVTVFPHYPIYCGVFISPWSTSVFTHFHMVIVTYNILCLGWYYHCVFPWGFHIFPFSSQSLFQPVGFHHLLVISLLKKPKCRPLQYFSLVSWLVFTHYFPGYVLVHHYNQSHPTFPHRFSEVLKP